VKHPVRHTGPSLVSFAGPNQPQHKISEWPGSDYPSSRSQAKLESAVSTLGKTARAVALDTGDVVAVERFFTDEAPWDHIVVSAAQTPSGPVRTLLPERAFRHPVARAIIDQALS